VIALGYAGGSFSVTILFIWWLRQVVGRGVDEGSANKQLHDENSISSPKARILLHTPFWRRRFRNKCQPDNPKPSAERSSPSGPWILKLTHLGL
jgi:hypothetical protein